MPKNLLDLVYLEQLSFQTSIHKRSHIHIQTLKLELSGSIDFICLDAKRTGHHHNYPTICMAVL